MSFTLLVTASRCHVIFWRPVKRIDSWVSFRLPHLLVTSGWLQFKRCPVALMFLFFMGFFLWLWFTEEEKCIAPPCLTDPFRGNMVGNKAS